MGIRAESVDPESQAFTYLIPFTDEFRRTVLMSEIYPKSRDMFSVVDMIRKEYNSETLKSFMSSYFIMGMPLDRKRVLEVSEIAAARRLNIEAEQE